MRRAVVLAIAAVILGCSGPQHDINRESAQKVFASLLPPTLIAGQEPMVLEDRAHHFGVPGVSVAVIDDFELKWVQHFGAESSRRPNSVSDLTVFSVGSLSKAATAVTVLSLVRDGLIDLDGDVNHQLTSWRVPENEYTTFEKVTPRRLLNHTGGLPTVRPQPHAEATSPRAVEVLNGNAFVSTPPVEVVSVPGSVFRYSNVGYEVLRLLIEDRCGLPFAEVAATRVFEPLGMKHTTFVNPLPAELLNRMSIGHNTDGNRVYDGPVWHAHVAAGGLWTTAADYAKLVVEIQKTLAGRSEAVLTPELARAMVSPHDSDRYGLGVFLHQRAEKKDYFSHIGDGLGFVAGFSAHRGSGQAAVVMTNGVGGIHLAREIMAGVARVYGWPDYLPEEQQPLEFDPFQMERVVGRYRSGFDRVTEIRSESGRLYLHQALGPARRLYPVAEDVLVCRERRGEVRVVFGVDGSAEALVNGLADELGRVPADPAESRRLQDDELTAREKLVNGLAEDAIGEYRALYCSNPSHSSVSEGALNRLGYDTLKVDAQAAVAVFELNVELRPDCANCYDSLGEGLLDIGQVDEAVANYRRSLELDPNNENARKVLAKIGVVR